MNETPEWFLKMSGEEQCKFIEKAGREGRIGLAASLNNGWISVKDMVPPTDDEVLVFWGGDRIHIGWLDPEDGWETNEFIFDPEDVTHWQPLPGPPKEAGSENRKEKR